MKYTASIIVASAGTLSSVSAHGLLTSPTPRHAGTATEAVCGQQVYNNQASDSYGNIHGGLQVAATQTDYNAGESDIWLCKGYKFADNCANIQSWTAGQVVDFKFDVRAPHTGYANVSIVNTATNSIIGEMLLVYDNFGIIRRQSLPTRWPSRSRFPAILVIPALRLHYWNAASIDQTYASCIDFTVGGSEFSAGSSSSTAVPILSTSAIAASSSSAPVSSAIAASASVVAISAPVLSSMIPTTLQTLTRASAASAAPSSSTESAAGASSTSVLEDDEDDDC